MTTTFSLRRVAQYFAKHYAEYGRTYVLTYGIIIAVLSVMAIMRTMITTEIIEVIYPMSLTWLVVVLIGITGISVRSLDGASQCAAIDLTLPMSSLERYLFLLVNTLVMGVLVQLAIVCCFDFWDEIPIMTIVKFYPIIHPIILVAYCWARRSKMAFAGLVWLWAGVMLLIVSLPSAFGGISMGSRLIFDLPDVYFFYDHSGSDIRYVYNYDFTHPTWLRWLYTSVMYVLAYAIAYFKLRERRLA